MSDTPQSPENTIRNITAQYLASYGSNGPWQWDDDFSALSDDDDKVIVFMEELIPILTWLSVRGLPRFGSVIFLLIACRTDPDGIFAQRMYDRLDSLSSDHWTEVRQGLETIAQFPAELRTSTKAKAAICELAFEGVKNRMPHDDSLEIVSSLKNLRSGIVLHAKYPLSVTTRGLSADIQQLARSLANITEENISRLLGAGTEEPLPEISIDLPPTPSVSSLIADLREDRQLAGLMAIVRDLTATVHIPRSPADPDRLPLGGVSDITNHGTLDKLLLSELAQDDEILATRLALNEALYLRREAPPRQNTQNRMMLLDAGIRLWGRPRLLACAAALATATTCERSHRLDVFRTAGDSLEQVALETREGLMSHLGALEPDPHPGPGFAKAAEALLLQDDPGEMILVTHADSLADLEFRQVVATAALPLLYVLAVQQGPDKSGQVRLHRFTRGNAKILSTTRIDENRIQCAVEGITRPDPAAAPPPPVHQGLNRDLPVIYTLDPFPLLLTPRAKAHRIVFSPDHGILALCSDGRVLHLPQENHGGHQLAMPFPKGQVMAMLPTIEGIVHIPYLRNRALHLFSCDLNKGQCQDLFLCNPVMPQSQFALSRGHLLVSCHSGITAYALGTGERVASGQSASGEHFWKSRFFTDQKGSWFWAYVHQGNIEFKSFPNSLALAGDKVIGLFDQYGVEGPLALVQREDRNLVKPGGKKYVVQNIARATLFELEEADIPDPADIEFSYTGRHLYLPSESFHTKTFVLADNYYHGWKLGAKLMVNPTPSLEPEAREAIGHERGQFRIKLFSSGLTGADTLYVCTLKGKTYFHFILDEKSGHLMMAHVPTDFRPSNRETALYSPRFLPPGRRPRKPKQVKRIARWRNGSLAFLDSRGLLHLMSSDHSLPQITLTLVPGRCAAWATNGKACGPEYHFPPGDHPKDDADIFELLQMFCANLRHPDDLP